MTNRFTVISFIYFAMLPCLVGQNVSAPKSDVAALIQKSESGDVDAMVLLGRSYLYGWDIAPDVEKAAMWLDRAAQKGSIQAQKLLGAAYLTGKILPQNMQLSAKYLSLAAQQGDAFAQYQLGMLYLHGGVLEKSDEKAFQLIQLAANQGYALAEYDLGVMFAEGIATAVDKKRACEMYEKAADQNQLAAINNLGKCYELGEGVKRNPEKAISLYLRAADAGHIKSQNNLAILYGGAGQLDKSYFWLRVAEGLGAVQNRPVIDRVKSRLTAPQIEAEDKRVLEWRQSHAKPLPEGVHYKPASDAVNAAAKTKLEQALASENFPKDLLKVFTCGPLLWAAFESSADKTLLQSKVITLFVSVPETIQTEARGMITEEQGRSFWAALLKRYPSLKSAHVRKATTQEIVYYWATIPFDIEEPFFAVDAGSETFIAHFGSQSPALFWIDLVGDLSKLKHQKEPVQPKLVRRVEPNYPPLAAAAHVQGYVILQIKIDKKGNVAEANVVSGPPLLIEAALIAVKQWTYEPVVVDKAPVEAQTTVTLSFRTGPQ